MTPHHLLPCYRPPVPLTRQPSAALRVLQTSPFVRANATAAPDRIVAASQKDVTPSFGQTTSLGQSVGGLGHATGVGITGNVPKPSSSLEKLLYTNPLPSARPVPLASPIPEHQKNSLVWYVP